MKTDTGRDWTNLAADLYRRGNAAAELRHSDTGGVEIPKELTHLGIKPIPQSPLPATLPENGPERELLKLQLQDVARGLRARGQFTLSQVNLDRFFTHVVTNPLIGDKARGHFVAEISAARAKSQEQLAAVMEENPETFCAITSSELRKFRRQLERGRIVETPYVTEKKEEVLTLLSRGQVVFLHGETGTGKTELALIAGRAASGGKEPILVRGYRGMTSEELYGHMTLTSRELQTAGERHEQLQAKLNEYRTYHPKASEEEQIEFLAQALLQSDTTITQYVMGSVYRAAAEGRTLIIDEANYIPPELMAKMNAILTKRPGEKIDVQEDGIGPITVAHGFGIILTGNINPDPKDQRYQGRSRFDLAFEDRIRKIPYDYLPQAVEGRLHDYTAEDKQLFTVVVASLLSGYRPNPAVPREVRILETIENRHGSLYLPGGEDGLKDIWRLCKFAALTQQAFAGTIKDGSPYGYQRDGVTVGYRPEVALSPRVLMSLLNDWKGDGFQAPLDHYLKTTLLDRATKTADKEYLYQLAKKFDFFQESDWPSKPADIKETPKSCRVAQLEFVPGRAVITSIYGDIPERTVWPNGFGSREQDAREAAAELLELSAAMETLRDEADKTLKQFSFLAPQDQDPEPPTANS